ncbi:MAG: chitinase [Candidatus Saccharimonadales bacterium]
MKQKPVKTEPERRLSPWRVLIALMLVAGIAAGSFYGLKYWKAEQPTGAAAPWFGAYVDVTATPTYSFEQLGTTENRNAVLSFIVSSPSDPCTPSWGAAYTMDQASSELDLDRRIARLQQQEGSIAVSFGGLLNDELALKCTDPIDLKNAYKSVVDKYNIDTIDLDLEQSGLTDSTAGVRRATAIAELQKERRAAGKNLAVWVTLPVAPFGLTEDGTNAISWLLAGGIDLAGVNVMTMDYGGSRQEGQSMQAASESALIQTHRQLGILYDRAGIHLNSATLWTKLGATPMIGQNDVTEEVFTLEDAKGFNDFVRGKGMGRMSMWSANRDITCGANYVDLKIVSDSCSGVEQNKGDYSTMLGKGFSTSLSKSSGAVTSAESSGEQVPDDPASSPYPIWTENQAYLQGAKVVWHHHVYVAKWWNQGEVPDNPVLQSWQTPWELIGPVLPGEKPIEQTKLPAGTFPEWIGTQVYNTGDRVLFEGVPYQAKWWNQGESPAAASSNATSSPWTPLTQTQINEILDKKTS